MEGENNSNMREREIGLCRSSPATKLSPSIHLSLAFVAPAFAAAHSFTNKQQQLSPS